MERRLAVVTNWCAKSLEMTSIFRCCNAPQTQSCAVFWHSGMPLFLRTSMKYWGTWCTRDVLNVYTTCDSSALLYTCCVRTMYNVQKLHTRCAWSTLYALITVRCVLGVYTLNELNSALWTCFVHYRWTLRCTLQVRCRVKVHSLVGAHTVYTNSALIGECPYSTLIMYSQMNCSLTLYAVSIHTGARSAHLNYPICPVLQRKLKQCPVHRGCILSRTWGAQCTAIVVHYESPQCNVTEVLKKEW